MAVHYVSISFAFVEVDIDHLALHVVVCNGVKPSHETFRVTTRKGLRKVLNVVHTSTFDVVEVYH